MPENKKDKIIKVGVVIFVVKNNKLLFGKRRGVGDGFWGLPGGHLEYGESLIDGAKRELLEETGLIAKKISFLNVVGDYYRDDCHYIHISFLADNIDNEPRLMEPEKCYEWQWFDSSALPSQIFVGHRGPVLAFLQSKIFLES